jgi:hypothetical protein
VGSGGKQNGNKYSNLGEFAFNAGRTLDYASGVLAFLFDSQCCPDRKRCAAINCGKAKP